MLLKLHIKKIIFPSQCLLDLKQNVQGTFIGLGELGQIIIQDKNNQIIQLSSGTLLPIKLMD